MGKLAGLGGECKAAGMASGTRMAGVAVVAAAAPLAAPKAPAAASADRFKKSRRDLVSITVPRKPAGLAVFYFFPSIQINNLQKKTADHRRFCACASMLF